MTHRYTDIVDRPSSDRLQCTTLAQWEKAEEPYGAANGKVAYGRFYGRRTVWYLYLPDLPYPVLPSSLWACAPYCFKADMQDRRAFLCRRRLYGGGIRPCQAL